MEGVQWPRVRRLLPLLLVLTLCAPPPSPTGAPASGSLVRIYVGGPADGSLAARARMLTSATDAQIVARPARRGAEALGELVGHDDDRTLAAVAGPDTIAAALLERASPRLESMVPVARIASDALVIAVAASSPVADIASLRRHLQREASAVRFAGSAVGSIEHQLAALLVKEAAGGVRPLVFAAYGSAADAGAGVSGGQSDVLVARYGDAKPLLQKGLRALAVSSAERLPGLDLPTLRESQIDIALVDWAVLVAPPRVSGDDVAGLRELARRAHASSLWSDAVKKNVFVDDFSTDGMTTFVGVEISRATALLRELALVRD